jgi:hypothetical protein
MAWWVRYDGEKLGPWEEAELVAWLQGSKALKATVRQLETNYWRGVAEIPQFARALGVEVAPSTVPVASPRKLTPAQDGCLLVISAFAVIAAGLWVSSKCSSSKTTEVPRTEAPVVAPDPAAAFRKSQEELASFRAALKSVEETWVAFDARTKAERTKQALTEAHKRATAGIGEMSQDQLQEVANANNSAARQRMAPMIRPETTATGHLMTTLVPSGNPAACLLWGSMWANNDETLASMQSLGFEEIDCGTRQWNLAEEAGRCFLYWKNNPRFEKGSVVFLWKTLDFFRKHQMVGVMTGDDATLAYMGLVSKGGQTLMPGGKYVVVQRGDDWVQIRGVGNRVGQDGFVEAQACHRAPEK